MSTGGLSNEVCYVQAMLAELSSEAERKPSHNGSTIPAIVVQAGAAQNSKDHSGRRLSSFAGKTQSEYQKRNARLSLGRGLKEQSPFHLAQIVSGSVEDNIAPCI